MKGKVDQQKIRQQATYDLVALLADEPSQKHAEQMADRQLADPKYRDELREAGEFLANIESLANSSVVQSIKSRPVKSRLKSYMAMAASLLVAIIIGALLYQGSGPDVAVDRYVTRVGEQRELLLDDGSTINLNTNSELLVTMTEGQRQLILKRGEAFFTVAKQPERPFSVDVNGHTVTVLGTAFNLSMEPDTLQVAVVEGRVAVHKSHDVVDPQVAPAEMAGGKGATFSVYVQHHLVAGQAVAINTNDYSSILSSAPAGVGAWRSGFLSFSRVPLYLVVKELNRYSPKKILVEDRSLIDLPISATVKVDRINAMLRSLEASQGIRVQHFADRVVLIDGSR